MDLTHQHKAKNLVSHKRIVCEVTYFEGILGATALEVDPFCPGLAVEGCVCARM